MRLYGQLQHCVSPEHLLIVGSFGSSATTGSKQNQTTPKQNPTSEETKPTHPRSTNIIVALDVANSRQFRGYIQNLLIQTASKGCVSWATNSTEHKEDREETWGPKKVHPPIPRLTVQEIDRLILAFPFGDFLDLANSSIVEVMSAVYIHISV